MMSDRKNERSVTSSTDRRNKEYECDVCEKRFTRPDHLVVHQRTHTGEKPFECDVCEKRFTRPNDLVVHQRTHTGEKPFECHVCEKRLQDQIIYSYIREHTLGRNLMNVMFVRRDFLKQAL